MSAESTNLSDSTKASKVDSGSDSKLTQPDLSSQYIDLMHEHNHAEQKQVKDSKNKSKSNQSEELQQIFDFDERHKINGGWTDTDLNLLPTEKPNTVGQSQKDIDKDSQASLDAFFHGYSMKLNRKPIATAVKAAP